MTATRARPERQVVPMQRQQRAVVWLVGLILAVSGLGCTSTRNAGASGRAPSADEACFDVRTVDSFSPLGYRFVYLRSLRGDQYLLTLDSVYTSLPNATGIRILGTFGRVCSDSGARITYRSFSSPIVCRIIRVEAVASKDAARRLVEERSTAKPQR